MDGDTSRDQFSKELLLKTFREESWQQEQLQLSRGEGLENAKRKSNFIFKLHDACTNFLRLNQRDVPRNFIGFGQSVIANVKRL